MRKIIHQVKTARSGVVLWSEASSVLDETILTELLLWVKEIGRDKSWFGQMLPTSPNSIGVIEALYSETGSPGSLQFNASSVSFSPRSMNLQSVLEHDETDLVVLIGQHNQFLRKTLSFLKELKVIQISPLPTQSINPVWFPVGQIGVSIAGTVSRLDGLPVFIASICPSDHKTAKDWINTLSGQVAG